MVARDVTIAEPIRCRTRPDATTIERYAERRRRRAVWLAVRRAGASPAERKRLRGAGTVGLTLSTTPHASVARCREMGGG